MILLWGEKFDGPIAAVASALSQAARPFQLLDGAGMLAVAASARRGSLGAACGGIELNVVDACLVRPPDLRLLLGGACPEVWSDVAGLAEHLLAWADTADALFLNRPCAMWANHSKPYQARQIACCGFAVPASLITTDPAAAVEFWERHGDVIYKSVSGVRSIVSRLTPAHRGRLTDVSSCPTQFQEYIPGDDYRVHVVGEAVFACRVCSTSDDYRYGSLDGRPASIQAVSLPDDCTALCLSTAAVLRLPLAGIDLRLTPDGRWFCFEVNPSPGFTWFEAQTGQPITSAVSSLLASAH
jgi:glutathione synthase/RimK-type ligase-like ATP-grasp enzyme